MNKLSAGASIGVTPYAAPSAGNPVAISYYLDDADDSVYFFSDIPDCSVAVVNGALSLVYGSEPAFPAYLAGADDMVKSNYVAWAALYGADTAGAHETAFLLNIDPHRDHPTHCGTPQNHVLRPHFNRLAAGRGERHGHARGGERHGARG